MNQLCEDKLGTDRLKTMLHDFSLFQPLRNCKLEAAVCDKDLRYIILGYWNIRFTKSKGML